MFFKNAVLFSVIELPEEFSEINKLEKKLDEFKFAKCGPHDFSKSGWGSALGEHGKLLVHSQNNNFAIRWVKEDKILPSSVVKVFAEERIAEIESKEDVTVKGERKKQIIDDCKNELVTKAFTKQSEARIIFLGDINLLVVESSSSKRAEDMLSLLRKTLGSLKVRPIQTINLPNTVLTSWVKGLDVPSGMMLGQGVKLKSFDDGLISCKNLDISSADEIVNIIDSGFSVYSLDLDFKERASFNLDIDFIFKKIKFSNELILDNYGETEDAAGKLDADLYLMATEFTELFKFLFEAFGGLEN